MYVLFLRNCKHPRFDMIDLPDAFLDAGPYPLYMIDMAFQLKQL